MHSVIVFAGKDQDGIKPNIDRVVKKAPLLAEISGKPESGFLKLEKTSNIAMSKLGGQKVVFGQAQEGNVHFVIFGEWYGPDLTDYLSKRDDLTPTDIAHLVDHEGIYSLFVHFSKSKISYAFGDRIGQRSWRYSQQGQNIAFSPHDLVLIASGLSGIEIDPVTKESMELIGWSVRNRSIYQDIHIVDPGTYVQFKDGHAYTDKIPKHALKGQVFERVVSYFEKEIGESDDIVVELSAGADSRAALGFTRMLRSSDKISVFSEGPEDSVDVKIAEEICRREGLKFSRIETPHTTAEKYADLWQKAALEANGHIDISILTSAKEYDPNQVVVGGDGAEIYTGYFNPYRLLGRTLQRNSDPDPFYIAKKNYFKVPDSTNPDLMSRINDAVGYCNHLSNNSWGTLCVIYSTERVAIWKQKIVLFEPNMIRKSPFYGRLGVLACVAEEGIPAQQNHVHLRATREGIPSALSLPINERQRMSDLDSDIWSRLNYDVRTLTGKVREKLIRKFSQMPANLSDSRVGRTIELLTEIGQSQSRGRSVMTSLGLSDRSSIELAFEKYDLKLCEKAGLEMFLYLGEELAG